MRYGFVGCVFAAFCVVLSQPASASGDDDNDVPVVSFPYPMITEVFFNVPKPNEDSDFDANSDGERDARTDEFIELYNPHSKPIDLTGYTLVSRLAWRDFHDTTSRSRGVVFTFPKFTLKPGYVAVVFNDVPRSISGPVGSEKKAPRETNSTFDDAYVFGVSYSSRNRALRNSGDFVLLLTPDNQPLDCVYWGKLDIEPPLAEDFVVHPHDVEESVRTLYQPLEVNHTVMGSVARPPWRHSYQEHVNLNQQPFSPGSIVIPQETTKADSESRESDQE